MSSAKMTCARQRALDEARRFAASWLGLGEVLSEIVAANSYQQWGFDSFEAYCRQELSLRGDTPQKLTRSFAYVQKARPQQVAHGAALPALDVVDLLSQARQRTGLTEAALHRLEQRVLDEGPGLSRAQLMRQLRREDPQAFRPASRAEGDQAQAAQPGDVATAQLGAADAPQAAPRPPADPQMLRKTLALAERLAVLLAEQGMEAGTAGHMQALIGALRQRVVPPALSA